MVSGNNSSDSCNGIRVTEGKDSALLTPSFDGDEAQWISGLHTTRPWITTQVENSTDPIIPTPFVTKKF